MTKPNPHVWTLRSKHRASVAFVTATIALLTAGVPAEDIQFPADMGVFSVKTYGVVGNGVADDTKAIQAAIDSVFPDNQGGWASNFRTLYFPNGTYMVSNTITWRRWTYLQGQSQAGTVIKLKDACTGYGAGASKPVLHCVYNNNMTFDNCVYNFTVSTGSGNPGAIAFRYNNHNGGTVRDLTLKSEDGQGAIGLDMTETEFGPGLLKNITVIGFDKGIATVNNVSHATFVNITLKNQRVVGMDNNLPVSILNLTSVNTVPAVRNAGFGQLVLINADCSGGSKTACAIDNRSDVYLRNVTSSGYQGAIKDHDTVKTLPIIDEYITGVVFSAFTNSPRRHLRLPIEEPPEVFEEPVANWVTPRAGTGDDAQAIQDAIDGGAKTIYFHMGQSYTLKKMIHVRGVVRRIIGNFSNNGGINADPASFPVNSAIIRFDGTGTDPITLDGWAPGMYPYSDRAGFEIATSQTLYFRRSSCIGFIRSTAEARGKVFLEDTHTGLQLNGPCSVWASHYNMENNPYDPNNPGDRANRVYVVNNGARLWILGMKTEAPALHIQTSGGGKSELLGGFFRDHFTSTIPFFRTTDGSISASYVEYDYDGQHSRGLQAIETRAGVTQQVDLGSGTRMVGLYSGFDSTVHSQSGRNIVTRRIRSSTTGSWEYYAITGARIPDARTGQPMRHGGRSMLCVARDARGEVRVIVEGIGDHRLPDRSRAPSSGRPITDY